MIWQKNKKGQVTIFIIIGVLIVATVVLFFVLKGDSSQPEGTSPSGEINPERYLRDCMEDDVRETLNVLGHQGGYIKNPLNISFKFNDEPERDISYLCYTDDGDKNCEIISPSVINNIEKEIEEEIGEGIDSCWEGIISSAEDEGYEVNEEFSGFEADLEEGNLILSINGKISLNKGNNTKNYENFKTKFSTHFYNLGKVAQDIVNSKSNFGTFNRVDYSMKNPEYKIDVEPMDITRIYSLSYRETGEMFRFAVRGK